MENTFKNIPNIKIVLVYALLAFGGLWNYLGYFTNLMNVLSGPVIIIIALYLLYETLNKKLSKTDTAIGKSESKYKKSFIIFFFFVVISSWFLEFVGSKTGYPFGIYSYGDVLKPQIMQVPIAIGFAWFSTLIASVGIMQKFSRINLRLFSPLKKAFIAGVFMTIFDYVLEYAAVNLGYWTWHVGIVPFFNYIAWFVFGSFFAFIGFRTGVLDSRLPEISHHLYFAQIIFFALSMV
jgi:hypothetical protein